jgi:hypothetical protein
MSAWDATVLLSGEAVGTSSSVTPFSGQAVPGPAPPGRTLHRMVVCTAKQGEEQRRGSRTFSTIFVAPSDGPKDAAGHAGHG